MKFTEFFWDFDGTLFDTYPRVTRAYQKALADVGVQITDAALLPLLKVTLGHAARTLVPGMTSKEFMVLYHKYAEDEGYDTMTPYPGALDMLKSVADGGGRNYLYTHRGATSMAALAHYGITDLFCDFVTGEEQFRVFPQKPAPDALLYLMKKHALRPERCVMVGDRDIDLLAGINAGMAGALFDPDGFYRDFDTPYKYTDMRDMRCDLAEDT